MNQKIMGLSFEPRYAEICAFRTKRFETRNRLILFLYQNHRTAIQKMRLIQIQSHAIVKPFLVFYSFSVYWETFVYPC